MGEAVVGEDKIRMGNAYDPHIIKTTSTLSLLFNSTCTPRYHLTTTSKTAKETRCGNG